MKFETVSVADVPVAPRGRKAEFDVDLTNAFERLKEGQALNLSPKFGQVPKDDRPRIGQMIRKNWRSVRDDDCRIDFGPDGTPFVRAKVAHESEPIVVPEPAPVRSPRKVTARKR